MEAEKIDTERCILEKLSLDDTAFIYELVNTAGWVKNIGDRNVRSFQDAQNYVQKIIDDLNVNYWTVSLKNSVSTVGIVTLIKREHLAHHDIGFAFLPQYTQNGYAYETTKALLNEITKRQVHTHILAITIIDNHNSIRLLEKLGFVIDSTTEVENELLLYCTLTVIN